MIIKKWDTTANSGAGGWVAQSPKVNAADIVVNVGAGSPVSIFAGGTSSPKILPAYLPDSVFDSLFFAGSTIGSIGSAPSRGGLVSDLITKLYEADAAGRSFVGYYWVITSAGTITGVTGIQENFIMEGDPGDGEYATLQFKPQDGAANTTANTSSGTLEVGDWFVIEKVEGNGTSNTPWVFTASVINNSFEVFTGATGSVAGTAGIVPGAAAGQQNYFLRGDATWAVPIGTTYSAGNGIALDGSNEFSVAAGIGLTQEASGLKMTQPFISGTTTPSASYQVANNIWFDLN